MKHLEVSGLRFARGDFNLSASISLDRGSTGVILGPSGCGKTTLLRCIAGLERQEAGSISVGGEEIGSLPPEKRAIGFIFQDLALFDHLTGRGNIEFGLKLKKIPGEKIVETVAALADKLRISPLLDRKPFSMSGGEKQRLALARAIATKPGLLLMDEPLSSLDAPLRRELRIYLRETLTREGITALHVTHDVEEALDLGDVLFIMKGGRILARGTPQKVFENPPDAWCVRFLGLGSLLPLLGIEKTGETCIADTPFGRFSCPARACAARDALFGGGGAFLFIPSGAAAVAGGSASSPTEIDVLDTRVERAVFHGNGRRLSLRPMPRGPGPAAPEPSAGIRENEESEELGLELDVALSLRAVKGERLRLSIDGERCAILSARAEKIDLSQETAMTERRGR